LKIRRILSWRVRPGADDPGKGDFDALMNWEGGTLVTTAKTRRTFRIEAGSEVYFLKTQRIPRLEFRYFLRPSALMKEARSYERMARLGLRIPAVVAAGERRRLGFMTESLLLTAEVPGAIDLETWAGEGFRTIEGIPRGGDLMRELHETVDSIHRKGYRFGALKWRNILAAPPCRATSHLVFIDQRNFRARPARFFGVRKDSRDEAILESEEKRWAEALKNQNWERQTVHG
jgi:hypothetical protein